MRFAIALLALCALAAARPSKRYDGYQVLKIVPASEAHLALLRSWEDRFDFWLEATHVGREVHMMVDPKNFNYVRAKLLAAAMEHGVHIADVQKQIDEEFDGIEARRAERPETMVFNYDDYNTYEDYLAEIVNLATNFCPTGYTCSYEDLPLLTHEGRVQRVLKLFRNNPPQPRYAIWYDSQIHAREWLAGATLMKVIETIFKGTDAESARFREDYDWYFLPIVNPDGYAYTWSTERLWRKNRMPTSRPSNCIGVDLNRNYPYTWSEPGASNDPCSDTYYGDSAGSEIETQNVDNYAESIRGNLVAWINFHTYGYYWLTNWGDCSVPSDHASHQVPVYTAVCAAIEATHNTQWDCGNSCQILYATSGSIIDHMKAIHGVRWAHTPELRGNSFVAAPDQIPLSYEEIWNGLVAKLNQMEQIGLP